MRTEKMWTSKSGARIYSIHVFANPHIVRERIELEYQSNRVSALGWPTVFYKILYSARTTLAHSHTHAGSGGGGSISNSSRFEWFIARLLWYIRAIVIC